MLMCPEQKKNKKTHNSLLKLVDGVHPTEFMKGNWARIFMQVITKTRSGAIIRPLHTVALAQPPPQTQILILTDPDTIVLP